MVEAGAVERHQEVDRGIGALAGPGEDGEVAAVAAVEHRGLVVVAHHGHGSRTRLGAEQGGQQQRGQLGVAQGVGADGQSLVVLEQAQGQLFAGLQEMRLVADRAHAGHHVGQPAVHLGHDVDQARAPGEEHGVAPHGDRGRRSGGVDGGGAVGQPGLDDGAHGLLPLRCHSVECLSSCTRSNHKNPYGGRVMV